MRELKALLEPRSVAVIGASPRPGALGQRVVANLHAAGFSGPVYPVHPRHASVQRIPAYRSVSDLPTSPDLAIVCTPPPLVAEQLRLLGEKGIRMAIVLARDPDGAAAGTPFKRSIEAVARASGLRWLGPTSAGVLVPRLGLNAGWIDAMPKAGKLALVSQSSSVAASALAWANERGIGFSCVVTLGDSGDVDVADLLDLLVADGRTQAILLYLDGIADGRKFMVSARAAARLKPVVVLWADSPAASDAGELPRVDHNAVCRAAFERAGLLQVSGMGDWFDAVETLGYGRRPVGDRLSILANGQGPAMLAQHPLTGQHPVHPPGEDVLAALTKILPAGVAAGTPLNLGVDADGARYEAAMDILLAQDAADALLIIVAPTRPAARRGIAEAIIRVAKARGRAMLVGWLGERAEAAILALFAAAEISLFDSPEKAAQAYLHLVRFRRGLEALRQIPERRGAGPSGDGELRLSDDSESVELLRAYGAISSTILRDESRLDDEAAGRVLAAFDLPAAAPSGRVLRRIPLRLTIGNDGVFGRAIAATVGSRHWILLPALNAELAAVPALQIGAEIGRVCEEAPAVDAVIEVLVRVAEMIVSFPEIVAGEISAFDWDGVALYPRASRIWVAAYERGATHLAVHPYPRETEERIPLRDGRVALVRPLRPADDLDLINELLANVSSDDLFLRYCRVLKEVPPEVVAKMTRVDYDREMVFIALCADASGRPQALGVVEAFASPDNDEAEFSILLRSDLKGTGLGKRLMQKIIAYCRGRKIRYVVGLVLRENQAMRGLATHLGFATRRDPDDDMVTMTLHLPVG